LQSEIQKLSTGVEEYKDFLTRHSKDIDRIREDTALRTKLLEEKGKAIEGKSKTQEDRTKAVEERIKEIEDRLIKGIENRIKGQDEKIGQLIWKQVELEKSISVKEVSIGVKGLAAGTGDLYKEAYETFQKGDLEGARGKFEAFLKQYPNTELSDNAQFWIGETYYLKKDFEKAILEYEKAIAKYPEGDKISVALFQQALAFLELGDKTNARNLLKRVIERYPHSDQAEMARKRLEGIK
jgi:tol-pal system protein YbgF